MTKWTPEGEDAYRQGFKDGIDSVEDPSPVIGIIAGACGGFLLGLLLAALVHWLT